MLKVKFLLTIVFAMNTLSAFAVVLPELPRAYVDTSMPTTSITKTVCNSGCDYMNDKLQQAIDEAQLGTTILLQPGVTYTPLDDRGFILKNKTTGAGWIVIKPAGADTILPAPGTRLTPSYSNVMPKIVRKYVGMYAMTCDTTAHHYRIIGVEILNPGNVDTAIVGAAFVNCSSTQELSLQTQSHHILFDRVYIHGPSAGGSSGVKFGLILNGQHEGVIDSTIEDITYGSDAITVISWAGAGPFVIKNNTLSSSGENIMFGGADTQIANLIPSDVEIRHNYIYKPLKWRDDVAYNSGPNKVLVKNLYESKNVQRVLIDGNVFENMWPGAQVGFAITLTPRQASTTSTQPWTRVQDVTITNNIIRSTANGIAISGWDPGQPPTSRGGRILVKNNLLVNNGGYPGTGVIFQLGNGASDVTIQHNTLASLNAGSPGVTFRFTFGPGNNDSVPMERFTLQDNFLLAQSYPIFAGGGCTADGLGSAAPSFVWTNSAFVGPWPTPDGCVSSRLPQGNGNAYPENETAIGYANPASGDYKLTNLSPYKNAASDGKDIGVDWNSFNTAQDPRNLLQSIQEHSESTISSEPMTVTTTTSLTPTSESSVKGSSRGFLGKLKHLMDKVR